MNNFNFRSIPNKPKSYLILDESQAIPEDKRQKLSEIIKSMRFTLDKNEIKQEN